MKPEMMATIRDYDPSNTSDPITKAWDSTQNKVWLRHGLRTPNEGINKRYLKNWAEVADKICFGRS